MFKQILPTITIRNKINLLLNGVGSSRLISRLQGLMCKHLTSRSKNMESSKENKHVDIGMQRQLPESTDSSANE